MNRARMILIPVLALIAPLFAAPVAAADVASCTFTAVAGPVLPGAFSIQHDVADGNAGDSFAGDPLTDTDNGSAERDGTYSIASLGIPAACLAVDSSGPADDGSVDTGLYTAAIAAHGWYENRICGTGTWRHIPDDGRFHTTIDFTPVVATGPGEDITEAFHAMEFAAGSGRLIITAATKDNGEALFGRGAVNIVPAFGNCVLVDVTQFQMTGAFALAGL